MSAKDLKIAVVTMSFPYNRETFAINELKYLHDQTQLTVHCLRPRHPSANNISESYNLDDIKISYLSFRTLLVFLLSIFHSPRRVCFLFMTIFQTPFGEYSYWLKALVFAPRIFEIFETIRKEKPTVVHAYWSHYPSFVSLLVRQYLPHVKLSVTHVAYDVYKDYNVLQGRGHLIDQHFSICKENLKYLDQIGIPPERIAIHYHGIPERFVRLALKPKKKLRILCVGTLLPVKNMALLISVFAEIKAQHPTAELIIGGDGPLRAELEAQVQALGLSNVTFAGYLLHHEVMNYMNDSEIFMLLSKNERLPNVVKEAMLMKCVCVVSETPGIDELITDSSTGFIVNIIEKSNILTTVNYICTPKNTNHALATRARQNIEQNFVLETNMDRFVSILMS